MKYKSVYLIGICGVAMGTLACMLKEKGCQVSGSDHNMYPPMDKVLDNAGIKVFQGFNESNIGSTDCVIVGNAISRGNPELEYVLDKRIPYMSMAGALYEFFLQQKEVIAVCGTHGKTTTTALLAHILTEARMNPSFFVGGVAKNFNSNYQIGEGQYFIIEGDEYDSSFFEKIPKFMIYRPHHTILTSLEYDHADIYNSFEEIKTWFRRLVNIIPSNGLVVYNGHNKELLQIMEQARSHVISYGKTGMDFIYEFQGFEDDLARIRIACPEGEFGVRSSIFGDINFMNILAAVTMSLEIGIEMKDIMQSVATFQGVKRRQELLFENDNIRVYEDFAHHPTAIRGVLETMREKFSEAVLWALYEPRSATSRRNIFQDELPGAFHPAQKVLIKRPFNLEALPQSIRLDITEVCDKIQQAGGEALPFKTADEIITFVMANINPKQKNVIVIMSNGAFDGIYEKLISQLRDLFCDKILIMTPDK